MSENNIPLTQDLTDVKNALTNATMQFSLAFVFDVF